IANYLRLLGFPAKAHSGMATDVDLNRLAVAAGLIWPDLEAPFVGRDFGLSVVTCEMDLASDQPLAAPERQRPKGPKWWLGTASRKSALTGDPYARRAFRQGPHPFERLTRVDTPTTYINEANVPRVPKRTDMFARAQFGDLGDKVQAGTKAGHYVRKSAPSTAQRRALGAFVLLQDGPPSAGPRPDNAQDNHDNVLAASYWLGIDAAGISRCPDWTWYSHDATGAAIQPPHDQAISMIVDQGFETMEGASGDDWISVAQSMRAYLRFSHLGGVIARQIRNLGYSAKAHTVIDGEVLQPPLLLLSGLGEVSRIGEVILNPFLGPRLKSGVVTTDMPLTHDKPIDFGLQAFCNACNKCARECPSGAITAGPKTMFNGYEIWKSDSQKCASYRITTEGGAMCGRCMKTCPWNLEGLFAEAPFRWAAMNVPAAAPMLARLDDTAGRGEINAVKTWWWDIALHEDGGYRPTPDPVNRRVLQKDLQVRPEDQTMAVYPAPLAPPPWPWPFPMDREAGIAAHEAMLTPDAYKAARAAGTEDGLHTYSIPGDAPVQRVEVTRAQPLSDDVTLYEFSARDGASLPPWTAGAHIDIVVAPEFLRQYSLCGDPADRDRYQIAVLNEPHGRGGSALLHRIFSVGRRVFISHPINHFPLVEEAPGALLMGGGIGITPMIAFAHRLSALGRSFTVHYSAPSRTSAAFDTILAAMPWSERVRFHVSAEGTRADLDALLRETPGDWHVYTCGPESYMQSVMAAAEQAGFPETARHLEYFSAPVAPERENHPFTLRLSRSGRDIPIPADQSAAAVLNDLGITVPVKCSDGICGVCACQLISGKVEHRDYVLSAAQRKTALILCQSRAADPDGTIEVDL
ncbi:MAG: 2Fe-2S iron-sulfur cluster-binding protein, partial [Pseudomonadota bacterium]